MAGRERLLGPGKHIREGLPDTGSTEHPQDKELNPSNQKHSIKVLHTSNQIIALGTSYTHTPKLK